MYVETATGRVSWNPPMAAPVRPAPGARMSHPNAQARMSMPVAPSAPGAPSAHMRTGTVAGGVRPPNPRLARVPSMGGFGHAARGSMAANAPPMPRPPQQRAVSGGAVPMRSTSGPPVRPIGAPAARPPTGAASGAVNGPPAGGVGAAVVGE